MTTKPRPGSIRPPARSRLGTVAAMSAITGLLAALVAGYLDPPARYLASAPIFFLRPELLEQALHRPGGVAEWLGAWLAQADAHTTLGAMVLGLAAAASSASAGWLVHRFGGRPGPWVALPGLLPVALYARYQPPALAIACGVLLAVCASLGSSAAAPRAPAAKLGLFAILGVAVWQIAGITPCLLYLLLGGLGAVLEKRNRVLLLGCGVGLLGWALAVHGRDFITYRALLQRWGGQPSVVLAGLLHAVFPLLVGLGLWRAHPRPASATGAANHLPSRRFDFLPAAEVTLILALAALVASTTFDPSRRDRSRLQAAAESRDWSRVLALGRRLETLPAAARLQMERALFHQGRLLDDLLTLPLGNGADMLASLLDGVDVSLPLCDTFLELGHVNQAEHYVQEFVEVRGESPAALWRLAVINVLKDRPVAARVFLTRLGQVPFHRDEARRWLRNLENDPKLNGESRVAEVRDRQVNLDAVERRHATDTLLRQAVQANRANRMAAEYLLAQRLLTRRTEDLGRDLDLVATNRAGPLPRHLAEAALTASRGGTPMPVDLHGPAVVPELQTRFGEFARAYAQGRGEAGLERALATKFGDTYWFYDVFEHTGSFPGNRPPR